MAPLGSRSAIQARLGHASITATLNTYGHLMPSAFNGVGDKLGGGKFRPFDLGAAVRECAQDLVRYGVRTCVGDRYAGDWVAREFTKHGVTYRPSERTKSEAFLDLLPLVTTERVEMPDDPDLVRQLRLLERRRGVQGKDVVDHPAGGHDDRANVLALVAAQAASRVGVVWAM